MLDFPDCVLPLTTPHMFRFGNRLSKGNRIKLPSLLRDWLHRLLVSTCDQTRASWDWYCDAVNDQALVIVCSRRICAD